MARLDRVTHAVSGWALALALVAGLRSVPLRAADELLGSTSITIAIDDYASVPDDELARAQTLVNRIYAAIGVRVLWLDTRRLVSNSEPGVTAAWPSGRFTLLLLDRAMTALKAPAANVIGSAPGTELERGQLAYIFYDRIRTLESALESGDAPVLGVAMAHEIGHLLLPYGAHSDVGVMRGEWNVHELSYIDVQQLTFTARQADSVRRRLTKGVSDSQ